MLVKKGLFGLFLAASLVASLRPLTSAAAPVYVTFLVRYGGLHPAGVDVETGGPATVIPASLRRSLQRQAVPRRLPEVERGELLIRNISFIEGASQSQERSSIASSVSWNVPKCMPRLTRAPRSRWAWTASAGFMWTGLMNQRGS